MPEAEHAIALQSPRWNPLAKAMQRDHQSLITAAQLT